MLELETYAMLHQYITLFFFKWAKTPNFLRKSAKSWNGTAIS